MTRFLVILIALLLAWTWVSRIVRGLLRSPRTARTRSLFHLLQTLGRAAAGSAGSTSSPKSKFDGSKFDGSTFHASSPFAGEGGAGDRQAAPQQPGKTAALLRCRRCDVHVLEAQLTSGVCGACVEEERAGTAS